MTSIKNSDSKTPIDLFEDALNANVRAFFIDYPEYIGEDDMTEMYVQFKGWMNDIHGKMLEPIEKRARKHLIATHKFYCGGYNDQTILDDMYIMCLRKELFNSFEHK